MPDENDTTRLPSQPAGRLPRRADGTIDLKIRDGMPGAPRKSRRYVVEWETLKMEHGSIIGTETRSLIVNAYDARDAGFQVGEPMGGFKTDRCPRLIRVTPADW